uniref:DRBM domain-containing protein n=1 Tax=Aegilops tauschii subsp. strangulata TaxID=200361 RepID=A0A453LBB0_AEGTS
GRRGAGEELAEEEVVPMEDAVKMLVEHLVKPALRRGAAFGAAQGERYVTPDKQRAVAQQIHTAIILYNYYHRKMSPQLAFADPEQFFECASLSVGEDLLAYLSMVHEHENNSGKHAKLSITHKVALQACEIAEQLDASKHSPEMALWPISKVAVLLLDPTKKKCLVDYSANTKGIWSIIEKELDGAAGNSHSTNQPAGQESTAKGIVGASHSPFMLQRQAYSEVERRTGMKVSNLHLLDETMAYSLSNEKAATKVFIVEYEPTMKGSLEEISLEDLISSMTGPLFVNDPFPKTTSVVEYYHILPYKEILSELLHRKWSSDSSLNEQPRRHGKGSLHSIIDENVEEQDENSTSKLQKRIKKVSTPKQSKQAVSASKHKKSSKRKSEASMAAADVCAEGLNSEIPTIKHVIEAEPPKSMSKSRNTEAATAAASGETKILQSVEKNKSQEQSKRDNMPQDVFPTEAPHVELVKNRALECENMDLSGKSGGTTEYNVDDQIDDSLRSIQKIRDEILLKESILQERSAQCDMDMQTLLSEGKMTPKAVSIISKYKETCSDMTEVTNSSCSGDGGQPITKRKKLREALLRHCQELDEICRGAHWISPRYTLLPSASDGMYHASVRLRCLDFEMSITGDLRPTPHEARCSAASNMILELHKKAEQEQ